jgi:hypothetical protein
VKNTTTSHRAQQNTQQRTSHTINSIHITGSRTQRRRTIAHLTRIVVNHTTSAIHSPSLMLPRHIEKNMAPAKKNMRRSRQPQIVATTFTFSDGEEGEAQNHTNSNKRIRSHAAGFGTSPMEAGVEFYGELKDGESSPDPETRTERRRQSRHSRRRSGRRPDVSGRIGNKECHFLAFVEIIEEELRGDP